MMRLQDVILQQMFRDCRKSLTMALWFAIWDYYVDRVMYFTYLLGWASAHELPFFSKRNSVRYLAHRSQVIILATRQSTKSQELCSLLRGSSHPQSFYPSPYHRGNMENETQNNQEKGLVFFNPIWRSESGGTAGITSVEGLRWVFK